MSCNTQAHAQASALPPLQEIVVTSSRVNLPLRQVGTSVTIVNSEEITARGNLTLTDVLRQMPSIQVSNDGGAGKTTILRIRGEEGFRTLTIMDGIRLSDPSTPQIGPQMEQIMSSGVSRVEILRGPQGLSYGADAGGVVNISSRSGIEGLEAGIDAQAGAYGTSQLTGNIGAGNQLGDFFISANHFETDGFNTRTTDDIFQDKDGFENETLHLRGGLNVGERWRVDLVHRHVDSESLYYGCFSNGNNGHDCVARYQLNATRAALNYQSENFTHSFAYNVTATERDNLSSGILAFAASGELNRWEYVGSSTNLPGFDLVFGADLEAAMNGDVGRDNTGIYLEYLSDFSDQLFITAGIRHDNNEDFGTNTSHRLSGAYLFDLGNDTNLKIRGSYGSGFRAPSPYEIAYNSGPFAFPPASDVVLGQEASEGWELAAEYLVDADWRIEAVYFDQDVEDEIYFDLAAFSGYLQDIGTGNSRGIELIGEWQLNANWRLTANYTYNDTERPNGQQRLRRPENLFNTGVSWLGLHQRLKLNAFLRVSQDGIDESAGQIVPLDDYSVLDLSGSYDVSDRIQLYGRIENLLDEGYQEIATYNTAGRAAYLGVRVSFQ